MGDSQPGRQEVHDVSIPHGHGRAQHANPQAAHRPSLARALAARSRRRPGYFQGGYQCGGGGFQARRRPGVSAVGGGGGAEAWRRRRPAWPSHAPQTPTTKAAP
ncbi:hypothetical protein HXX76_011149 [Chlamydomonas incerta]|uniref:Uncharacterized protein n=1 Tax=Chlamydomonas incerta TaxID=51695 RepID=A0A835SLU1_CHLIN|nr:hypothetical protein HXX76_011149 [Chlamydomonas incerta]|eukprot:KAG2429384.1 hypothetical protein HXX76_011149 [Chlamydomonas incerta]